MIYKYFISLLWRNLKWLVAIPIALALSIYFFTRHEKKEYTSETVIYTGIASGSSLNESNKADYLSVSNAFDNLLSLIHSREAKQEVALQLLSEHIYLEKYDPIQLSMESYSELSMYVPDTLKHRLKRSSLEGTLHALISYMQKNDGNQIYTLINSEHPYYSISALQKIKAVRVNSSDLIKITYDTYDPAICKRTLELMIDVFMRKNRLLKEGRAESVVAYFEEQTRNAYARLDSAEQAFLNFNKQNEIINYFDQTKAIAGQKENLYALDHNLQMDEKAAEQSLIKIDKSLEGRSYQPLFGSDIIRERERLSDIYSKIALIEVEGKVSGNKDVVDSLKKVATGIENSLRGSLEHLYKNSNTPNGIPTKQVLDEWLSTTLAYEGSKAKLSVMDRRKKEFAEEYKRFAPLGAMLKKIERGIGVIEREYLDHLHSLSVARLAQQNNELTTKLSIVDPPFLPLKPNTSKRKILIIVGFLGGFFIVFGILLTSVLTSRTLQEPNNATKAIGIPLFGIFPLLSEDRKIQEKAKLRLIQSLLANINLEGKPIIIGFVSIEEKEGKSTIIDTLYEQLALLKYRVEKAVWDPNQTLDFKEESQIILMETPALNNLIIRPGIFPQLHHTLLVCRANRAWKKNDQDLLQIFYKTTGNKPSFILNGVQKEFAEEHIGEVTKKRFLMRSI